MPRQYSMGGPAPNDNLGYVADGNELKTNIHTLGVDDAETGKEEEEEDPWNVVNIKQDYQPWNELSGRKKAMRAILYPIKVILVLGFLYLFICSLDFLSSSFKLLGGKKAGEVFQRNELLANPVAGLMMGVLVTVLVQSSSTSTSIVITMVGAQILTVKTAVYIVMGANIGTSVTNTIVSLGQITDKNDFRRAFAGATVHDMFNWMSVLVLLPVEAASGYLFRLSGAIIKSLHLKQRKDVNQDLLKTITKPFTTLIVQVSSSGIKKIAKRDATADETTLMKFCCDKVKPKDCCNKELDNMNTTTYGRIGQYSEDQRNAVCLGVAQCVEKDYTDGLGANDTKLDECAVTPWSYENVTRTFEELNTLNCTGLEGNVNDTSCCEESLTSSTFFEVYDENATSTQQEALCDTVNNTCYTADIYGNCTSAWVLGRSATGEGDVFSCGTWTKEIERDCNKPCEFLFRAVHEHEGGTLSDEGVGAILLVISLALLCICLFCIVKLLQSLLQGPMARLIKKFVNADFPGYCGYFTGYLAILIGAGMTILVQSSSIFTSALTPLVGMGVITLDRMYPLTLGSNIGTTATGILAALASDVSALEDTLQVALCHLFFNITGIAIFYPLPFFRPPIPAAKFLGNTTAKYRWFAIVYLFGMFFLFPLAVFALSLPGWYVMAIVFIPVVLLLIVVGIIKCIQAKKPSCLPAKLRSWKFLPRPLRSLQPYDSVMRFLCFCKRFQTPAQPRPRAGTQHGFDNVAATTKDM